MKCTASIHNLYWRSTEEMVVVTAKYDGWIFTAGQRSVGADSVAVVTLMSITWHCSYHAHGLTLTLFYYSRKFIA